MFWVLWLVVVVAPSLCVWRWREQTSHTGERNRNTNTTQKSSNLGPSGHEEPVMDTAGGGFPINRLIITALVPVTLIFHQIPLCNVPTDSYSSCYLSADVNHKIFKKYFHFIYSLLANPEVANMTATAWEVFVSVKTHMSSSSLSVCMSSILHSHSMEASLHFQSGPDEYYSSVRSAPA